MRRFLTSLSLLAIALSIGLLALGCKAERRVANGREPVVLTDANFTREVLDSPKVVLVEIWSSSCEICSAMKPVLRELTKELSGQVKVAALLLETNQFTAEKYAARALPVFLVFSGGKEMERREGRQTKDELMQLVNSVQQSATSLAQEKELK